MKKTFVLAAVVMSLSACAHRQTREAAHPAPTVTTTTTTTRTELPPTADTGTVSGSPSSLGAVSSGRGH